MGGLGGNGLGRGGSRTAAGTETAGAGPVTAVVEQPCDCPLPTKKICVPEHTTKKTPKVVYDVKCTDYCLTKCNPFAWLWKKKDCDCDGCETGNCATCTKPRVRHVLVKKFVMEEKESVKCVPQEVVDDQPCKHGCFSWLFGEKK